MKRFVYIFVLMLAASAFIVSCQPDDPDDNTPADDREYYQGSWLCTESSSMSYVVNITIDTTTQSQIKLFNFHHLGFEEVVSGIVSGTTLTIPSQTVCNGTITVEGTATMQSTHNTMEFYYYVNDGVMLDTIQAVYTKQ